LLERILLASSNPNDLVADFFCGSGTLPVTAARLGRRFIASDGAWRAVHITRCRLVEAGAGPFSLHRETSAPIMRFKDQPVDIQLSGAEIKLPQHKLDNLDYWEADPAWDGQIFRSAAQAVRPLKKTPIRAQLALPSLHQNYPIGVRLVEIDGSQSFVTLEKTQP
jgi:hypothetical protein